MLVCAANIAVCRSYLSASTMIKERSTAMGYASASQSIGLILGPGELKKLSRIRLWKNIYVLGHALLNMICNLKVIVKDGQNCLFDSLTACTVVWMRTPAFWNRLCERWLKGQMENNFHYLVIGIESVFFKQ